jgi:hypothetical protein
LGFGSHIAGEFSVPPVLVNVYEPNSAYRFFITADEKCDSCILFLKSVFHLKFTTRSGSAEPLPEFRIVNHLMEKVDVLLFDCSEGNGLSTQILNTGHARTFSVTEKIDWVELMEHGYNCPV